MCDLEKLAKQIRRESSIIAQAQARLAELDAQCTHFFDPHRDGAYCVVCRHSFGWQCGDESPDGVCHYEVFNGLVLLISGRRIAAPEGLFDYNDTDCCIYCGQPEERK